MIEKLPGRGNRAAHLLDRYLGIALVFALGFARRRRSVPTEPKRIGLLNTAALGDTILMSGPIADLRAEYPRATIILLSGPSNCEIARLLDHLDQVIRLPVFDPLAALRQLRAQQLDILLDFGPWCRFNALLAMLSGARFAIGFRTPGEGRHFGYDLAVEHSGSVHELENHRRIVGALGVQTYHLPSIRRLSSSERRGGEIRKPYVVCHLWPGGSAARHKEWPTMRWVALAEHLTRNGYHVVFTGSANQRSLNDEVIARIRAPLRNLAQNLAGSSLDDTLRILAGARLAISVDTGLVHMAAALDVPLVALYGPSSAERWGPVSGKAVVVDSPLTSSGYLSLGFERLRNPPPCMEAICYQSVESACDVALGRTHRERPLFGRMSPIWVASSRLMGKEPPATIRSSTDGLRSVPS